MPLSRRPSAVRSVTDCDHSDHGSGDHTGHMSARRCLSSTAADESSGSNDAIRERAPYKRLVTVRLRNTHSNTTLPVQQAIGLAYWFHTPPIKGAMIIS